MESARRTDSRSQRAIREVAAGMTQLSRTKLNEAHRRFLIEAFDTGTHCAFIATGFSEIRYVRAAHCGTRGVPHQRFWG